MRWGHGIYFGKVVPRIGALLSDADAYRYLPRSVAYLPEPEALVQLIRDAGFPDAERKVLSGGISQLLVGTRVSVIVGFAAALISAVLGSLVGLAGGYFGGWTDRILDATENWFLVIPTLPLMIVLARVLEPSLTVLIAVIGLTSWAGTGRIVRAQVLTLRERAGRTFMRDELPVYCAHCSVNNEIQPVEWGGAPTSIEHPPMRAGEACVHHVYKDVGATPAEAYERIGKEPPK